MLTYMFNDYRISTKIDFPTQITLFAELGPLVLFGMAQGLTKAVFAGGNRISAAIVDFNKGKQGCLNVLKPEEFFGKLTIEQAISRDGTEKYPSYSISLEKNILSCDSYCQTNLELFGLLCIVKHLAPASLSLELWEPITVEKIWGKCNGQSFNVKIGNYGSFLEVLRQEEITCRIMKSFKNLHTLRKAQNPRLKAALHYFYTARRLVQAGDTIWEFVTEIILNYAKVIEVLFGSCRDNIRSQLKTLGYDETTIESNFIPIMILRSQYDVAHPRIAYPHDIKTPKIAQYIAMMECTIGELLKRIFDKYESESYTLPNDEEMYPYTPKEQANWDTINDGIKKRFFGDQSKTNN